MLQIYYTTTHVNNNLSINNPGDTRNSYNIDMDLPGDSMPPAQMLDGSSYLARVYYAFEGGVQYGQALKQPSVMPQNLNIWLTYLHQTGWKIHITPPSINISPSGGFSITPYFNSVYDTVFDGSFLLKWDKA